MNRSLVTAHISVWRTSQVLFTQKHTHTHTYKHMHTHTHTHTHARTHTYSTYMLAHTRTHARTYAHKYTHTQTQRHIKPDMQVSMNACTHLCRSHRHPVGCGLLHTHTQKSQLCWSRFGYSCSYLTGIHQYLQTGHTLVIIQIPSKIQSAHM